MRRIIVFNMISLDGFVAGPDGSIDWHRVDEEFNQFAIGQLDSAGALIFGRVTYELMESYWPTPAALQDDPQVASRMNAIPKIVVSCTLEAVKWNNTRLVSEDAMEEIARLKKQPGKDMFVFGSANLCIDLIRHGLIDEYRLIVNPVVLGSGIRMFQGVTQPLNFSLSRTRTFDNGNVMLVYESESGEG